MPAVHCIIAETQGHLDDAVRVRYEVFCNELGYLDPVTTSAPRELDAFDTLPTTHHIVAYADGCAVGSVRLLLPNHEVRRRSGSPFGLDIESKFDLGPLSAADIVPAEATRFCILATHRSTSAAASLHAAAVALSSALGVTHWIASANTETDMLEDARLALRVAERLGFVHPDVRLSPRATPERAPAPGFPLYDAAMRARAAAGLDGLTLPRTLALYASWMHARFVGPPIYDAKFRMCVLPILAAVADQRASVHSGSCAPRISPLAA